MAKVAAKPIRHLVMKFALALGCISLFLLMTLQAVDVLFSQVLSLSIPGAKALSESLLVAIVFLPLAWTQHRRETLRLQLVLDHSPPGIKRTLEGLSGLASLAVFGCLAWQAWLAAADSWRYGEYTAGALGFSLFPTRLLMALGLSSLVLETGLQLITVIHPDHRQSTTLDPDL